MKNKHAWIKIHMSRTKRKNRRHKDTYKKHTVSYTGSKDGKEKNPVSLIPFIPSGII